MGTPSDEAVQLTNDDATECKLSAVQLGYWEDPYISLLIRPVERKPPEINRGYYARKKGIELLIEKFLKVCLREVMSSYPKGPKHPFMWVEWTGLREFLIELCYHCKFFKKCE